MLHSGFILGRPDHVPHTFLPSPSTTLWPSRKPLALSFWPAPFMASPSFFFLFLLAFALFPASSPCSTSLSFNGTRHTFINCQDLPTQGASLAWSLFPQNGTIAMAFSGSAPSASGWVGWGLNPSSPQMVGTSTFIAYTASNGSNVLPYKLTAATIAGTPLTCSPIDYIVRDEAVEISGTNMSMLVVLQLANANQTTLNHVWNRGSTVTNFQPGPHSMAANDLRGTAQIDMASGAAVSVGSPNQILKNRHGIINTVGWGIILPLGVMSARYLKPFADPVWFYLHVTCQCIGYGLGVAGWATGLKLGDDSAGVVHHKHRSIGITLFALSTLQVMALLLRPKKEHKIRFYWNIYHHFIGFSVIILGILNVFFGFDILLPPEKWRHSYVGVLAALGGISLLLEIITWIVYIRRRNQQPQSKSMPGAIVNEGTQLNGVLGTFGPTEYDLRVV